MGYKFQFITLAGWHLVNYHTFDLARAYVAEGMPAYVRLQHEEFASEQAGYTATRHQREAGTGYFDQVLTTITGGDASTTALSGSTEAEQFGGSSCPVTELRGEVELDIPARRDERGTADRRIRA
jgi:isocitrate lyase